MNWQPQMHTLRTAVALAASHKDTADMLQVLDSDIIKTRTASRLD